MITTLKSPDPRRILQRLRQDTLRPGCTPMELKQENTWVGEPKSFPCKGLLNVHSVLMETSHSRDSVVVSTGGPRNHCTSMTLLKSFLY